MASADAVLMMMYGSCHCCWCILWVQCNRVEASLVNTLVGQYQHFDKFVEDKDQKAKLAHEIATMSDKHAQEIGGAD